MEWFRRNRGSPARRMRVDKSACTSRAYPCSLSVPLGHVGKIIRIKHGHEGTDFFYAMKFIAHISLVFIHPLPNPRRNTIMGTPAAQDAKCAAFRNGKATPYRREAAAYGKHPSTTIGPTAIVPRQVKTAAAQFL